MGQATFEVTSDLSEFEAVSITVSLRGTGLEATEACSLEVSFDDFATSTVLVGVTAANNGVGEVDTLVIPAGAVAWDDGMQLRFIADTLTDADKCRLSFARSCFLRITGSPDTTTTSTTTSTSSSTSSSASTTTENVDLQGFIDVTTPGPFERCDGPLDCLLGWLIGAGVIVVGGIIAAVAYTQHAAAVAQVMIYAQEPGADGYEPMRRGQWGSITGLPGGAAMGNMASAAAATPLSPISLSSLPEPASSGANNAPGSPSNRVDVADVDATAATRAMVDELASMIDEM